MKVLDFEIECDYSLGISKRRVILPFENLSTLRVEEIQGRKFFYICAKDDSVFEIDEEQFDKFYKELTNV